MSWWEFRGFWGDFAKVSGRLKQALELVDVRLLDHFIVTARQAVSLAEQGLL